MITIGWSTETEKVEVPIGINCPFCKKPTTIFDEAVVPVDFNSHFDRHYNFGCHESCLEECTSEQMQKMRDKVCMFIGQLERDLQQTWLP